MDEATSVGHRMTRDSLDEVSRVVWNFLTLLANRRYADANA